MKKRNLFFVLVLALLVAALAVPAMATDTPVAPNEVSAYANKNMKGNFEKPDGNDWPISRYCPVCNDYKNWYPLDTVMTKATDLTYHHYFLLADIQHAGGCYQIPSGKTTCMYLNGRDLTSTSIVFDVVGNLNLIGNGTETVSGNGYGNYQPHGDTFYMSAGSLNLYGGTYTKSSADRGPVIGSKTAFTLNVYGGTTITGGKNADYPGGNILLNAEGTKVNIYGGTITGGQATQGGNIAATAANCEINIYGGTISNGHATTKGGNIYSASPVVITGGSILDGEGATGGGNIQMYKATLRIGETGGEKVTISGGKGNSGQGGNISCGGDTTICNATISGGTCTTAWGGNIYIDSAKLTIGAGTTVENGAASGGGNINAYAATVDIDDAEFIGGTANNSGSYLNGGSLRLWKCAVTVDNTTFTDGAAGTGGGGNIFLDANTSVAFNTCTFTGGTASTGGNLYIKTPTSFTNCVFNAAQNATGTGTQIYSDKAVTLDGCSIVTGSVFADGDVTFKDAEVKNATVRQGKATLDAYARINSLSLTGYPDKEPTAFATLQVNNTFNGEVVINKLAVAPEGTPFGATLDSKYAATGDFTGKLILNIYSDKPWAFHDNGGLVVGNARTMQENDITWHKDNAAAVANYTAGDVILPGTTDLALDGGDYLVNVCGLDLNVTGTGSVTFFDTANKNFTDYGLVTVNGPAVANEFATAIEADGGNTYFMVGDGGALSFHRLDMKVDGVSIRPSTAGMYYSGLWQCDALLQEKIRSFGVAVSLDHQPDQNFAQDGKVLYTAFDAALFESGATKTSVLISNILVNGADNATRGATPIYATAYITVADGENSVTLVDGEQVSQSLKSVMQLIDEDYGVYARNRKAVDNFYGTWKNVMEGWNFNRIGKTINDGKSLKLLAITSSFGLNTTEALYDIAKAEGATDVTVGRLYASGCTLEMHANNIATNASPYQYTKISDATGGKWSIRYNTNMLTALQDEQWDIIFIQQGGAQSGQPSTYGNYLDPVLAYVDENKTNENVKYIWNMTWAYQQDSTQSVFQNVFHGSQAYMYEQLVATVQDKIGNRNEFSAIIPTGTAIQNVRNSFIGDNLCKDTFHLNNLGRVIAGYTLWSTITATTLTDIKLDTFASGSDYHDGMDVAVTLTQEQKAVIVEAINAALCEPYQVTQIG